MQAFETFLWAYIVIAGLTVALVAINVHQEARKYVRSRNKIRLWSHAGTVAIVASFILFISGKIVDRVIDSDIIVRLTQN